MKKKQFNHDDCVISYEPRLRVIKAILCFDRFVEDSCEWIIFIVGFVLFWLDDNLLSMALDSVGSMILTLTCRWWNSSVSDDDDDDVGDERESALFVDLNIRMA